MREFEQHLSPDLFDRLVEAGEAEQRAPELESAALHVTACAACRLRLEEYRKAQRRLESLKMERSDERVRTPDCPPEEEWASVATGLVGETEAAARVDHASRCAFCGPLLREAVEDLSPQLSDEERGLLSRLPSAQADNQQRLAARLASASAAGGRKFRPRHLWAWGVAAAAVLALVAVLIVRQMGSGRTAAEKLLAQAYTANRKLELRIPGAEYAPLSTVRGAETSQPMPLLRAEVLIGRRLAAHPGSAAWVALQGRAQLLGGNFQQARSTLQQALRLEPHSPAILTDLATAEFELAQQQGRDEDFMAAAEHLSEALELRPDDRVALYNRALVYESIGSLPLAVKDWERYLRVDPSSAWATKVAREHLDRLKKRLDASPRSELPPSNPAAAAVWLASRGNAQAPSNGTKDSGDEQLLDAAVTRWLPQAYAANGARSPRREAARTALDRLAKELVKRHDDHWLEDVLAVPPSPSLSAGLGALAEAARLNAAGRANEAETQARRAVKLLQAARSPAALRAEVELAYAYQREVSEASLCADTARSALRELGNRRYPWIQAQLLLERASGEVMQWHLGSSRRSLRRAIEVSRSSGYRVLYLRGIGFLADFATDIGDYRRGWRGDRTGLEEYWNGYYPPMRAYQFYADMTFGAEAAGDWLVAEALEREGVAMAAGTRNKPFEALARFRLATVADLAGDRETARQEFQRAAGIFAGLPPDPTFETYQGDCQVYLADLEVQTGAPGRALARLLRMKPLVQKVSADGYAPRYFRGLGEAYLSQGDIANAEGALLKAVAIAERGLHSLKSAPDRVSWVGSSADVYRSFVRAELKGRHDPGAALAAWEWFRSGPVRAQETATESPVGRLLSTAIKPSVIAGGHDVAAFRTGIKKWLKTEEPAALRDRTVVSYAEFSDGIEIWVLGGGGMEARWVRVPQAQFDRVARRFGQECADPKSSLAFLRSDGHRLYEWLIAPIESRLAPGRVLAFETDGSIAKIPLQALVDSKGNYLGDRFTVVFSPGLAFERALKPGGKISASDRLLSIGAPALSAGWQSMFAPLPEADDEARAVAASFQSATLLTGRQATLRAVLQDLPETEILHFAGHALAEGRRTGLLLASGPGLAQGGSGSDSGKGAEVLASAQLNPRNLRRCRLAVLSACSTAGGEGKALVDPGSLVGAFLLSGVPDVVASRWNVDSAATTRLMKTFYQRLLAGDSVARALRQAAESIRKNSQTNHPYFWAAFSAYGR